MMYKYCFRLVRYIYSVMEFVQQQQTHMSYVNTHKTGEEKKGSTAINIDIRKWNKFVI
uniref:Uncharacterized protein n=1 Tax=Arion vulgaris TaxID=1028688 RepID=A0A0B6YU28_9EUPU